MPSKFLIVTSSQNGADVLLDRMAEFEKSGVKIVRMSHSLNRWDLNKKYSLDKLAGIDVLSKGVRETGPEAMQEEANRRAKVLESADILIAPIVSLLSSSANKSILDKFTQINPDCKFDTVLVDDANLVDEIELIQGALRFGCQRLLLFGTSNLSPQDFSLATKDNSAIQNRTLFARAL